ncbi:hypothetical protein BVC80_857g52 [Macleaya cordata]|uniref:Uncharacterized protein n=1 Tax=Macleaya cordata TaxID=56857 RepID=A0A200Q709_MACCD|nr:hypothetical protein BVC80_857g52 [Macleaya cordata]
MQRAWKVNDCAKGQARRGQEAAGTQEAAITSARIGRMQEMELVTQEMARKCASATLDHVVLLDYVKRLARHGQAVAGILKAAIISARIGRTPCMELVTLEMTRKSASATSKDVNHNPSKMPLFH